MHNFTENFTGDPRQLASVRLAAYKLLLDLRDHLDQLAHDAASRDTQGRVSPFDREDYANAILWTIVEYLTDSQIDATDDVFGALRGVHHLEQYFVGHELRIDFLINDEPVPMESD